MDSFPPISLERHRLANGLRVVLHRDPALPLVAVNLWYHVGSKHERPGRTGFAHLFEHMLFQGSQHVPANDHFRLIQQIGGVANGSTWFDRTNYYETVPASSLELALWLEADRMGFLLPAMTAEKLENQRSVVMNERRQRVDNQPYGRAGERVHELLYPEGHPYHWPVIGYMDDIAAASLSDVETFFRTFYRPNNAVLTLAGDFAPDSALAAVERYFAELEAGPPLPEPIARGAPARTGRQREVLEDNVRLPRVYQTWAVAAYGAAAWYDALLLSELLTGGRASLLYEDLVYRRQIVQSVAAYVLPTEECATFGVVLTGHPETRPDQLEREAVEQLARLGREGIPKDRFERARNRLLASHWSDLQTLDRRADLLSQATTFFDAPEAVAEEPEKVLARTPADLEQWIHETVTADSGATVVVVPAGSAPAAAP